MIRGKKTVPANIESTNAVFIHKRKMHPMKITAPILLLVLCYLFTNSLYAQLPFHVGLQVEYGIYGLSDNSPPSVDMAEYRMETGDHIGFGPQLSYSFGERLNLITGLQFQRDQLTRFAYSYGIIGIETQDHIRTYHLALPLELEYRIIGKLAVSGGIILRQHVHTRSNRLVRSGGNPGFERETTIKSNQDALEGGLVIYQRKFRQQVSIGLNYQFSERITFGVAYRNFIGVQSRLKTQGFCSSNPSCQTVYISIRPEANMLTALLQFNL